MERILTPKPDKEGLKKKIYTPVLLMNTDVKFPSQMVANWFQKCFFFFFQSNTQAGLAKEMQG